jgi:hypothetical protein
VGTRRESDCIYYKFLIDCFNNQVTPDVQKANERKKTYQQTYNDLRIKKMEWEDALTEYEWDDEDLQKIHKLVHALSLATEALK